MSKLMKNLTDKIMFFDGAMGTMLQMKGMKGGEAPDIYNITHPEIITEIHREYLRAGCDFITTNTFGANSFKLKSSGYSTREVVAAAITNAKNAISAEGMEGRVYVACDIGSVGKLLAPAGDVHFGKAYESYKEVAEAAGASGADLFIIETMTDLYDAKAAILACKENTDLPVFCTMTLEQNDRTLTGSDITIIAAVLESLGADVIGLNCSRGPVEMQDVVGKLASASGVPVLIQPNAGLPVSENGRTIFPLNPGAFAEAVSKIAVPGVCLLGGCCGTTPAHINELIKKAGKYKTDQGIKDQNNIICSSTVYIVYDENTHLSGDIRVSPESDADDIIDEIYNELDEGCEAVFLLMEDGPGAEFDDELMCSKLNSIQSVIKLPLIFKSSSQRLLEMASRFYNGKTATILL